jgi:hypothetical protein
MLSNSHSELPCVSLQKNQNEGFVSMENSKAKHNRAYIILRRKEELLASTFEHLLHTSYFSVICLFSQFFIELHLFEF